MELEENFDSLPPRGDADVSLRGTFFSDDIPDDIFALIRLKARFDNNENFSLVDENEQVKKNCPIFHVRFKNRSTLWRYINKKTGEIISTESEPFPLTYFGNAGTKQKPSKKSQLQFKPLDDVSGIKQLFSEIFI